MGKVLLHGHLDVCILVSSSTSFSSTSFSSTASSTNRNKYRTPKQVKSLRTVPGKSFHTFRAVFAHCLNSSITHDAYSSVGLRPPLGGNYGQFSNWLLHCSQKQLRLFIAAERGSSCRSFLSLPLTKRALRDKRNFSLFRSRRRWNCWVLAYLSHGIRAWKQWEETPTSCNSHYFLSQSGFWEIN